MPEVIIKKVFSKPEVLAVSCLGTDADGNTINYTQSITRGVKTTVSDAILGVLKRSDEVFVEVAPEPEVQAASEEASA